MVNLWKTKGLTDKRIMEILELHESLKMLFLDYVVKQKLKERNLLDSKVICQILAGNLDKATEIKMEQVMKDLWEVKAPSRLAKDEPEMVRYREAQRSMINKAWDLAKDDPEMVRCREAYRSMIKKVARSEAASLGLSPQPPKRVCDEATSKEKQQHTKRHRFTDKESDPDEDLSPRSSTWSDFNGSSSLAEQPYLALPSTSNPQETSGKTAKMPTGSFEDLGMPQNVTEPTQHASISSFPATDKPVRESRGSLTSTKDKANPQDPSKTPDHLHAGLLSDQPSNVAKPGIERPLRDFKVIVSTKTATAYMTISDLVPAYACMKPNVVDYVELQCLFMAMRGQISGAYAEEELEFRGAEVLTIKDDFSLRFAIKEAYYTAQGSAKLILKQEGDGTA